ncbi:MAG: DUF1573 domain-containing protein [Thermoflexibacter sp.]|jgi:hypothetical protein|nr:DUF1573 domain-containing protein [Thermoflexibacter sp.]
MKKTFIYCLWLLTCWLLSITPIFAQIEFKRVSHHLGDVVESAGEVSVEFEYTNNGFKDTKIIMVQPSCGCTTPDWSKEAIKPTEKGKITVKFAPKGRWGEFSKTITVMTDLNQVFWLKIEGVVVEKKTAKSGNKR